MSIFSSPIDELLSSVASRRAIPAPESMVEFHDWVELQDKIETHVHLEAAVPPSFYRQRMSPAECLGVPPWQRAPFANLREFIRAWVDLSKCIRSVTDFEEMVMAFVQGRAAQRIKYSECYISPADYSFMRRRFSIAPEVFDFSDVLKAYVKGLKIALKRYPECEVRLIVDALWPSTSEERKQILESLEMSLNDSAFYDEQGQHYIVAVGLGGAETHHDIAGHVEFMKSVRKLGFKVDIHSGEGGDGELHKATIDWIAPDRVAHGFAAFANGYYFSKNIVMCPISNLLLGTFTGHPEEHPVFELLRTNVPVSVGTDDPLLLGHTLAQEFTFLLAVQGTLDKHQFFKIQSSTRHNVLAPDICSRVIKSKVPS